LLAAAEEAWRRGGVAISKAERRAAKKTGVAASAAENEEG